MLVTLTLLLSGSNVRVTSVIRICVFLGFLLVMVCCMAQAGMLLKLTGGNTMPLR